MSELSVKHLLGIKDLSNDDIELIFETADNFKEVINRPIDRRRTCRRTSSLSESGTRCTFHSARDARGNDHSDIWYWWRTHVWNIYANLNYRGGYVHVCSWAIYCGYFGQWEKNFQESYKNLIAGSLKFSQWNLEITSFFQNVSPVKVEIWKIDNYPPLLMPMPQMAREKMAIFFVNSSLAVTKKPLIERGLIAF